MRYSTAYLSITVWLRAVVAGISTGADYRSGEVECKIEKMVETAYVVASYQYFPKMSGCVSREQTPDMQSVHAVIIRDLTSSRGQMGAESSSIRESLIDIVIEPGRQRAENKPPIFVLMSSLPTLWRIHSQQISNATIGIFMISSNSRIDREHRRTKLKVRKMKLSPDSRHVESWIRKKLLALTTLIDLDLANVITLRAGIDPLAKNKCEVVSNLPNTVASHVEVQETRGCLARWNEGVFGRDVHIIELMSPTVEYVNNSRYDVVLNIRSRARPTASRHVVLVLKSHLPVHWRIVTHGLRGTLDIITDQAVDSNGTNTQSFRVAVESLVTYSGQNLIGWTSDKYGLPVSYTEAQLANQFDLVVDGGDLLPKHRPTTPHPAVTLDQASRDGIGGGMEDAGKDSYNEFIKDRKLAIIKGLYISCGEYDMTFAINKTALQYRDRLPSRVSYLNTSCTAQDNGTHLIFLANSGACGTLVTRSRAAIIYLNTIVVHWSLDSYSFHDSRSSFQSGHDISYPRSVAINVSCDYPVPDAKKDTVPADSPDFQFRMKLFRDATYRDEIVAFPAEVADHTPVYVQANISAEICIHVNIRNCSLLFGDPTSAPTARERPLIVNGCIVGKMARWINPNVNAARQNQHFEFQFEHPRGADNGTIIQCQLAVCTVCSGPAMPGVPLCVDREDMCGHVDESSRRHGTFPIMASVRAGPLFPPLLAPPTSPAVGSDQHTPPGIPGHEAFPNEWQPEDMNEGAGACEQVIRVEGLRTEVVVSIAFTAFIIGILLTASLWCIYIRTGPSNVKGGAGLRSLPNSGDSTPSSTAPITIHQVSGRHR